MFANISSVIKLSNSNRELQIYKTLLKSKHRAPANSWALVELATECMVQTL